MKAFQIKVPFENTIKTITVIPSDNEENDYSTYFELMINNQPYFEVRMNSELEWEICKGQEVCIRDFDRVISAIEATLYRKIPERKEERDIVKLEQQRLNIWEQLKATMRRISA